MRKSRIGLNPGFTRDEAIALLIGLGDKRVGPTTESELEADAVFEGSFCLNEYLYEEFSCLENACEYVGKYPDHFDEPKEALDEKFENHKKLIKMAENCSLRFDDELSKGESSLIKQCPQKMLVYPQYKYYTILSVQRWAMNCLGLPDISMDDFIQGNFKLPELPTTITGLQKKPIKKLKSNEQDDAILAVIKELNLAPLALPKYENGKSGVKLEIRELLSNNELFKAEKAFEDTWQRMFKNKVLVYKKESPSHK